MVLIDDELQPGMGVPTHLSLILTTDEEVEIVHLLDYEVHIKEFGPFRDHRFVTVPFTDAFDLRDILEEECRANT